jgi:hypothetical protein
MITQTFIIIGGSTIPLARADNRAWQRRDTYCHTLFYNNFLPKNGIVSMIAHDSKSF